VVRLTFKNCLGAGSPLPLLGAIGRLMRSRLEQSSEDRQGSLRWLALQALEEGAVRDGTELARALRAPLADVTRLIDEFEAKGWVDRGRSGSDRHEVFLSLTALGRRELERLYESWSEILASYTDEDLEELTNLLMCLKQGLATAAGALDTVR
jgi:DNA-binding MarR family transcriptional regulator